MTGFLIRSWPVSAHSLRQRLLRRLRKMAGAVAVKSHEVHFVRVHGQLLKRIRFEDAAEASLIERHLGEVGTCVGLPKVMARDGAELWMEYVHGSPFRPRGADRPERLADFFADLYRRGSRLVPVEETLFPGLLERDIRFLVDADVINADAGERLARTAEKLRPSRVWMGFDYIDPLPKNFIVRGDTIVGVDVEALRGDCMLGMGPAKALLRWLDLPASELLSKIADGGAPDIREQFAYVDLCFRCDYARLKRFQRKEHLAPPSILEAYLR